MGSDQSNPTEIQQFWQCIGQELTHIPGRPQLVKSTRRPELIAQRYMLQMINTNKQDQAAIFRERKINNQNIVSVYDFQIKKAVLGCPRNANFYDIVTEHIPYRLSNLQNLTNIEMIYIFHESLLGYRQLYHYSRTCYPTEQMIGVKSNSSVKVWINQNWSDNNFRAARNQKAEIDALFNTIKMCGDSRSLGNFNMAFYRMNGITFDGCIEMIRNGFSKEILQGKFALERRIKQMEMPIVSNSSNITHNNIINPAIYYEHNNTRPRAFSQKVRKTNQQSNHQQYEIIPVQIYSHYQEFPYKQLTATRITQLNSVTTKPASVLTHIEKPTSVILPKKVEVVERNFNKFSPFPIYQHRMDTQLHRTRQQISKSADRTAPQHNIIHPNIINITQRGRCKSQLSNPHIKISPIANVRQTHQKNLSNFKQELIQTQLNRKNIYLNRNQNMNYLANKNNTILHQGQTNLINFNNISKNNKIAMNMNVINDRNRVNFSYINSQYCPTNFHHTVQTKINNKVNMKVGEKKYDQISTPTKNYNYHPTPYYSQSKSPNHVSISYNNSQVPHIPDIKQAQSQIRTAEQYNFMHQKQYSLIQFQEQRYSGSYKLSLPLHDTTTFDSRSLNQNVVQSLRLQNFDYKPQIPTTSRLDSRDRVKTDRQQSPKSYYTTNFNSNYNHSYVQSYSEPIRQIESLQLEQKKLYSSPQKSSNSQKQGSNQLQFSQTKKVAQQFKYYLRSLEGEQINVQTNSQNKNGYEKNSKQSYDVNRSNKSRKMYESIPERWDEQQSFSMTNL